jgi:hypothetical protein
LREISKKGRGEEGKRRRNEEEKKTKRSES